MTNLRLIQEKMLAFKYVNKNVLQYCFDEEDQETDRYSLGNMIF